MTKLHHYITHGAETAPDQVAVEDPSRDTQITYGQLDALTDALADTLRNLGIGMSDRVGLYAPKSIGSVTALFAALKADAAYVPVDPSAPPARNAFIFKDCQVKAIVVARNKLDKLRAAYNADGGSEVLPVADELTDLAPYGVDLVLVKTAAAGQDTPAPFDGLSYILYTSGSTGKPKGVIHTHESARAFIDWCSSVFEPTPADKFSSHAPFHFDLSILDLYVPLKHGATLVLFGEDLGKQPQKMAEVIATSGITAWYSTPSVLRLLLEFGKMGQYDYSALRIVNFAGEVFPIKHLKTLKAAWPHPRYFNLYGPTETNVCTYFEVPEAIDPARTEPFPIGYACSDDECLAMDEEDQPVPHGEPGELYVHGGSVMQGYWNLPERNAQAFFVDNEGRKWYKTGDVVVDEGDGCYLFAGRRDRMVKRRGYRIELGEIESALYNHPSVSEAAVIALPDAENGVLIKAFLAWTEGKPSIIKLKGYCAKNLQLYMIPDRFVFLDILPKTSTDKVDYQTLKGM